MKDEKIKAIIKEKVNQITEYSEKINRDFDKDTIHNFRVVVKSLRSFLRLLRLHTSESKLKLPGKFKRLYHITGAIRDAQLELEKIIKNKLPLPAYTEKLYLVIRTQKNEWKKNYSKNILRKLHARLSGIKYDALHPTVLEEFINTRLMGIDKLSKCKLPTDNQVHSVRKHVKDILYTAKIADKEWKAAHKQVKDLPLKQLDDIADKIGDYHDERINFEHLMGFASKMMTPAEKNTITSICNNDVPALTKKKKSITALIKNFVANKRKPG